MECVFGMVGNGFSLVVADSSAVHSILVHKSNEDKIMILDSHKLMGASGEAGDRFCCRRFSSYIVRSLRTFITMLNFCVNLQSSVHGVCAEKCGIVSVP